MFTKIKKSIKRTQLVSHSKLQILVEFQGLIMGSNIKLRLTQISIGCRDDCKLSCVL